MTERNHTTPVTGRARTHDQLWGDDVRDGDYEVSEGGSHLLCVCPCGCGSMMNLPIATGAKPDHTWQWDGNRDAPTLNPSIRDLSGCKFHGYLRAGVWTFEGDSGQ